MTAESDLARRLEPFLLNGDQQASGAEVSRPLRVSTWDRIVGEAWASTGLVLTSENTIAREDLRSMAERARCDSGGDQAVMALFWNVLAWGVAGNWRNLGRVVKDVMARPQAIAVNLRNAAQLAYEGDPAAAYTELSGSVHRWGPAYFTKYLHFASNFDEAAKIQCLILDERVEVAWRVFGGRTFNGSAQGYATYCRQINDVARARGSEPGWVEGQMYLFGKKVGSSTSFFETRLELCLDVLGADAAPTILQTLEAVESVAKGRGTDRG